MENCAIIKRVEYLQSRLQGRIYVPEAAVLLREAKGKLLSKLRD